MKSHTKMKYGDGVCLTVTIYVCVHLLTCFYLKPSPCKLSLCVFPCACLMNCPIISASWFGSLQSAGVSVYVCVSSDKRVNLKPHKLSCEHKHSVNTAT